MPLDDRQKKLTKSAIAGFRVPAPAQVVENDPVQGTVVTWGDGKQYRKLPNGTWELVGTPRPISQHTDTTAATGDAIIAPNTAPTPVTNPSRDSEPKPEDKLPPPAR